MQHVYHGGCFYTVFQRWKHQVLCPFLKTAASHFQWNLSLRDSCCYSSLKLHLWTKQNSSILANWYYFFIDKMIVNWSSMDATKEDNFDTLVYDTFNQTYDWKSISHYTNKAFRKENTLGYTLVSKVSYFCWSNSKKLLKLPIFHCYANLFTETWAFQNHWNRQW